MKAPFQESDAEIQPLFKHQIHTNSYSLTWPDQSFGHVGPGQSFDSRAEVFMLIILCIIIYSIQNFL